MCISNIHAIRIKEGRDGSKPQCQQGKRITTDPPKHSNKPLVRVQDSQALSKSKSYNSFFSPKINMFETTHKKVFLESSSSNRT